MRNWSKLWGNDRLDIICSYKNNFKKTQAWTDISNEIGGDGGQKIYVHMYVCIVEFISKFYLYGSIFGTRLFL
jgi:hypothetical protein